jgi:hypothetical protein
MPSSGYRFSALVSVITRSTVCPWRGGGEFRGGAVLPEGSGLVRVWPHQADGVAVGDGATQELTHATPPGLVTVTTRASQTGRAGGFGGADRFGVGHGSPLPTPAATHHAHPRPTDAAVPWSGDGGTGVHEAPPTGLLLVRPPQPAEVTW